MFSNTLKRHSGHFRFGPWLAGILSSSKPANDYYYCGIFQEFHFWHCNRSSNSCNLPDSKSVPQKTDIFGIPIDSISNDEIVLCIIINTHIPFEVVVVNVKYQTITHICFKLPLFARFRTYAVISRNFFALTSSQIVRSFEQTDTGLEQKYFDR